MTFLRRFQLENFCSRLYFGLFLVLCSVYSLARLGYQVDAEILSTVIFGFSVRLSQENLDQARRTWAKYASQVVLTYASAERLIRSFGAIREPNLALQVYNRVRRDYTFTACEEVLALID